MIRYHLAFPPSLDIGVVGKKKEVGNLAQPKFYLFDLEKQRCEVQEIRVISE